jgi:hypothetical protein
MMRRTASNRARTAFGAVGSSAAIIAAALALAACSSPQSHPGQARQSAASPSSGQLGATLAVSNSSGTKLDVTVEKVIDPASGASQYSQPASGQHFVGVKLRLQNTAPTSYQNNANNEATIVLSDGKTKDAGYDPVEGCGNFDNGQVKLATGSSAAGCVTFQVPNGETVAKVRYGSTVFPGTTAEWSLP